MKDDSTLVWLSPSLLSGNKPHTRARINTFALLSKYTINSYAKKTTIFILVPYPQKNLRIKNNNIQRLLYIYINYYSPYL